MKFCIRCNQKGAPITLQGFPLDSFRWCTDKCLFLWCKEHTVEYDGDPITELIKNKTKELVRMEDVIDC